MVHSLCTANMSCSEMHSSNAGEQENDQLLAICVSHKHFKIALVDSSGQLQSKN